MGIRFNMYCKGHLAGNEKYRKKFDNIKWGSGHVQRDEFGLPICKRIDKKQGHPKEKEQKEG